MTSYFFFYLDWNIALTRRFGIIKPFADWLSYWYLLGLASLFIFAILFIQLFFLILAVWLFCRCWFLSSDIDNNKTYIYEDYLLNKIEMRIDNFRDRNLRKL